MTACIVLTEYGHQALPIIARLESLIANMPVSDALERARAYIAAGADGIMSQSKENPVMI